MEGQKKVDSGRLHEKYRKENQVRSVRSEKKRRMEDRQAEEKT